MINIYKPESGECFVVTRVGHPYILYDYVDFYIFAKVKDNMQKFDADFLTKYIANRKNFINDFIMIDVINKQLVFHNENNYYEIISIDSKISATTYFSDTIDVIDFLSKLKHKKFIRKFIKKTYKSEKGIDINVITEECLNSILSASQVLGQTNYNKKLYSTWIEIIFTLMTESKIVINETSIDKKQKDKKQKQQLRDEIESIVAEGENEEIIEEEQTEKK